MNNQLIAQPHSPLLELPVEVIWMRMADMERGFHCAEGVNLLAMSGNPIEYRTYIEHCRALRIKTRRPKGSKAKAA